jgi:hypothetical protein
VLTIVSYFFHYRAWPGSESRQPALASRARAEAVNKRPSKARSPSRAGETTLLLCPVPPLYLERLRLRAIPHPRLHPRLPRPQDARRAPPVLQMVVQAGLNSRVRRMPEHRAAEDRSKSPHRKASVVRTLRMW